MNEQYKAAIEALDFGNSKLKEEKISLRKKVRELEDELENVHERARSANQALATAEREFKFATIGVNKENVGLKRSKELLNEKISSLSHENRELNERAHLFERLLHDKRNEFDGLQHSFDASSLKIAEIEAENTNLKQEIVRINEGSSEAMSNMTQAIARVENENKVLIEESTELNAINMLYVKAIGELPIENRKWDKRNERTK